MVEAMATVAMEVDSVHPDNNAVNDGKPKVMEGVECRLTSTSSWISEEKLHTSAAEMLPSYWYSRSSMKEFIKVEAPDDEEGESSSLMPNDIHHETWMPPVVVKSEIFEETDTINNSDIERPLPTTIKSENITSTSSQKRDAMLKILKYQCVKCKLNFDSYNSLNLHINSILPCIDTVSTPPKKIFPSTKTLLSTNNLSSTKRLPFTETLSNTKSYESIMKTFTKILPTSTKTFDLRAHHNCKVCNRSFSCMTDLDEHMLVHHPPNYSDERIHFKENMERQFNENNSDIEISKGSHLEMLQAISEKEFQCHICGHSFYDDNSLQMHILVHNGLQTYNCPTCGKSFSNESYLEKHKLIHLIGKSSPPSKATKSIVVPYETNTLRKAKSPIISYESNTPQSQSPIISYKKNNTLQPAQSPVLSYENTSHQAQSSPDNKSYKCLTCGKEFAHKYYLTNHERSHKGDKPYFCDMCQERFSSKKDLEKHSLVHERPFQCDLCYKRFTLSSVLQQHTLTEHSVEKLFFCDVCDKGFMKKESLKLHKTQHHGTDINDVLKLYNTTHDDDLSSPSMVSKGTEKYDVSKQTDIEVHKVSPVLSTLLTSPTMANRRLNEDEVMFTDSNDNSDNPYKCGTCEKSFSNYVSLHAHVRTHTTPPRKKIFKCHLCTKAFVKRCDLKRHVMSHTGERPFSCDVCFKKFTRNSHLKTHKMLHTGEKPFRCPVCDKGFIKRSDMRKHLNTHDFSKNTPQPEIIVL